MSFLWVYILCGIGVTSIVFFLLTLSRDVFLIKRLKKKKQFLLLNFSFLVFTFISVTLVIYLLVLLKDQIQLLG
ncbi:hypothetical protein BCR21_15040 [Enterococcus ureasiticus]|uniref:Uncharacterized protein n=1 Tax=Enterococcus ureasiticus TaxID=903984 RepID=A0A1E5GAM8_9ENTE|nr:hypothetical protein [Enterococcus ureasiticus]OEG09655.1 hypothetical protein BCR21_15040 [Enterococcus ureasiticus]